MTPGLRYEFAQRADSSRRRLLAETISQGCLLVQSVVIAYIGYGHLCQPEGNLRQLGFTFKPRCSPSLFLSLTLSYTLLYGADISLSLSLSLSIKHTHTRFFPSLPIKSCWPMLCTPHVFLILVQMARVTRTRLVAATFHSGVPGMQYTQASCISICAPL